MKARVEVAGERSESSATYVNPNGTLTVEASTGPRWVRRSQVVDGASVSSWVDVDTTLVANPDGTVAPKAVSSGLVLSGGGDTVLARMVRDGVGLSTAAGSVSAAGVVGVLPKPSLSGDTATYPEVQPGVDLTVTATAAGFESNWVIKKRPVGALHLDLPVSLSGLTASPRADGGVGYADASGKTVAVTRAPQMWDATRNPVSRLPQRVTPVPLVVSAGSTLPADAATTPSAAQSVSGSTSSSTAGSGSGSAGLASAQVPAAAVAGGRAGVVVRHLGLSPDPGFLADPATVFPVVVDPTTVWSAAADTFVKSTTATTAYYSDTQLQIGFDGSAVYRSYVQAPQGLLDAVRGKVVTAAYLHPYNTFSQVCTASANTVVNVYTDATAFTASTTWNTKPTRSPATPVTTNTDTPQGSTCPSPGGPSNLDIASVVKGWAAGGSTPPVIELGAIETDPAGYKRFSSGNGQWAPLFEVTYAAVPDAPTSLSPADGAELPNATFTPSAVVSSSDGGMLNARLFVQDVTAGNTWVTPAAGTDCGLNSSSTVSTCPALSLVNGHAYRWQVQTIHTDIASVVGPLSPWRTVSIDTTPPAAPTVSCPDYPAGSWAMMATPPTSSTVTFTSASADTTQFRYWMNDDTPQLTPASGTGPVTGTAAINPSWGPDVLNVQAVDAAGNASTVTQYKFGAGLAVSSPKTGDTTQASVTLQAAALPASTKVTFKFRTPDMTTWYPIPVNAVTVNNAPLTAWPVNTVQDGVKASAPDRLVWNVATSIITPGAVLIQAVFTAGSTTYTTKNDPTLIYDPLATGKGYATAQVGPGTVSLTTGIYTVTATDVSVPAGIGGDLTVRRVYRSDKASVQAHTGWGNGWVMAVGDDAASSAWLGIADDSTTAGVARVQAADGTTYVFEYQGDTRQTFRPLGRAVIDGITLTRTQTGTPGSLGFTQTYTVADLFGNSTIFTYGIYSYAAGRVLGQLEVRQPDHDRTTIASYDIYGRLTRFMAAATSTLACTDADFQPGCRALVFTYGPNSYITSITLKVANPGGATTSTDVACYSYLSDNHLGQVWDPRLDATTCAASGQLLPTTYTYGPGSGGTANAGKLITITPAGLAPWTITYDATGVSDPGDSVLSTVSRTSDTGPETTTIKYNVPIGTPSTPEANPDLSATTAATWAQTAVPVTGTVVYAPGDTVSTTDLRDGAVTGIDVNGRAVNTAMFSGTGQRGWKITTAQYDEYGNTTRALTAGNRDRAVYDTAGTATRLGLPATTSSSSLAQALDTTAVYSADGMDQIESFGPYHQVVIPGTGLVSARAHTKTLYGTRVVALPADPTSDGPRHFAIQTTVGASQARDATVVNEADIRTTKTSYGLPNDSAGWTFKTPVRTTTVVPGGTDIIRETVLDPATGLVTQQRQPSATGQAADPGTRVTTYYTATGTGPCVQPAWTRLPCTTAPGAQPTTPGLPGLPTTRYPTYDYLQRVTTITETVTDAASATHTRTTTSSYENNGVSPRLSRTLVTGDVGTAIPAIKYTYNPTSGLPTGTSTDTTPAPGPGMAGTLTTAYDSLGRPTSSTDANGATTTQTYDTAGRPSVTTWTKADGTTTLATRTLTYGTATERRGMVTTTTDSVFGAITGTYDADGALQTQTYPNGLTETRTTDTTGDTVDITDTRAGVTWLHDAQTSTIHGQWATHSTDGIATRSYTYNGVGRLTTAAAVRTGGDPCEKRTYGFDVNGNRLTQARTITTAGACAAGTTTTLGYDNADRLLPTGTGAGLVYDTWGRITTLPTALAGSTGNGGSITGGTGALTNSYYVTDAVATQTWNTKTDTWTLDPAGRRRVATLAGVTKTNHYDDSSDNPAWIDEGTATHAISRYVPDLDGGNAAELQTSDTGTTTKYLLVTLHGDIITTSAPTPTGGTPDGATLDTDEYGNPYTTTTRYAWVGDKQRSTDALGGAILMGARLYNPLTGRFLSTDPVYGGNDSTYIYPLDPINAFDLDGRWSVNPVSILKAQAKYQVERALNWSSRNLNPVTIARRTSYHVHVSAQTCQIVCISASWQGGRPSVSGGSLGVGSGFGVGINHYSPKVGSNTRDVYGGGWGPYGAYYAPGRDDAGKINNHDWALGWAPGFGFNIGTNHTLWYKDLW